MDRSVSRGRARCHMYTSSYATLLPTSIMLILKAQRCPIFKIIPQCPLHRALPSAEPGSRGRSTAFGRSDPPGGLIRPYFVALT